MTDQSVEGLEFQVGESIRSHFKHEDMVIVML